MNKAPILLICLHADPTQPSGILEGGGTHAYLRELTVGLAARGHACHVVTRRRSPDLASLVKVSPLTTLQRIDIGEPGPMDKRLLDGLHLETFARLNDLWGHFPCPPRLIHSVYWNSGRVAMELSATHAIPFVHTVISNGKGRLARGATGNSQNREAVEERVFRAAARIFSISQDEKQDLVALYGVDPGKIVVIGRPVDAAYLSPAQDEMGNPRDPWATESSGGPAPE